MEASSSVSHTLEGPKKKFKYQSLSEMTCNEIKMELDSVKENDVQKLYLLLQRRNIQPLFECVQMVGPKHRLMFRFEVSFNDYKALGGGVSKQEAKYSAARNLLNILQGLPVEELPDVPMVTTSSDSDNLGNPIGWLQELCVKEFIPPPVYNVVCNEENKEFTMKCCIMPLEQCGEGRSKKIAKRIAAHKMLSMFHNDPSLIATMKKKE